MSDDHDEYERRRGQRAARIETAKALLQRRASDIGIESRDLGYRLCLSASAEVRWSDIEAWLGPDDWAEQLEQRQAARNIINAEHDAERVRRAVGGVLEAALALGPDQRAAKMAPELRGFADEHDSELGALLLGPTGIGKSLACVSLVDRLVRERSAAEREAAARANRRPYFGVHPYVLIVSATAIGACVSYGQADRTAHAMVQAEQSELLCIDDLGWEPEPGTPAIRSLLAARYERGKATIVTSGWTRAALRERYGDALLRRVIDTRGERGVVIDLHRGSR